MIVLGVDPGTVATGYGVVTRPDVGPRRLIECGVIRPPAGASLSERLAVIFEELSALILRHRPDALAVEDVFVHRNARSALILGHARGAVLLAAARSRVAVAEYNPREIKATVVGTGSSSKTQIKLMVARHLGLRTPPEPEDAADGVAVALTHCLRSARRLKRAVVG